VSYFLHRIDSLFQPTLSGGATSTTPSPRTKSIGIFRFVDWKRKRKIKTHLYEYMYYLFFVQKNLRWIHHNTKNWIKKKTLITSMVLIYI
jgi:hypothetical protein